VLGCSLVVDINAKTMLKQMCQTRMCPLVATP
jgi:hypothetical protein